MIYLDWAASAPPDPPAIDEAREVALDLFANPSSSHGAGRRAGERLAAARARFARLLEVSPQEIVFTSGGTESNGVVLLSLLGKRRLSGGDRQKARIVTTGIEHASVYEQAHGLENLGISCAFVPPGRDGIVDPGSVAQALDEETVMVSVMAVNNETGALQPLKEIITLVRQYSARGGRTILVHADAVQALGKVPFFPRMLGLDAASFSGHKIGGPRGIGALYLRAGTALEPLALGGGQEEGRRPGTENLPGICAMVRAAEGRVLRGEENMRQARVITGHLIDGLRSLPGAVVFPLERSGGGDPRFSPWIVSAGFPGLPGEVVVRTADAAGFCIGTGSACSTKKKEKTRVLEAMGVPRDIAQSAIRISTGPSTTAEEIDGLIKALGRDIPPLLAMSRGRS